MDLLDADGHGHSRAGPGDLVGAAELFGDWPFRGQAREPEYVCVRSLARERERGVGGVGAGGRSRKCEGEGVPVLGCI